MRLHVKGEFHAAHRLHDHLGECAYLHGHTYRVQVDVEMAGDDVFRTERNMGVDFSEIKGILKAHLKVADHACWLSRKSCLVLFGSLLRESDNFRTISEGEMLAVPGARIVVTDGEPTAELMARLIYQWLEKDYQRLGKSIDMAASLIGVTIWETNEQGATYAPGK